ncbi:MAG: class IV adenylate cyclase [Candidatus Nezhaarchaeales archaeon]
MYVELEVKARAPLDEAEAKLRGLGAVKAGEWEEVDAYFQHPCRDFASTDEVLRLRRRGEEALLTYKGPRAGRGAKARAEVELSVSSFEAAERVLRLLGFREVAEVRKRRSAYRLGPFTVCLDRVEGLGDFVEVELLADPRRLEEAEPSVLKLASELGAREVTTKSYLELCLEALGRGAGP